MRMTARAFIISLVALIGLAGCVVTTTPKPPSPEKRAHADLARTAVSLCYKLATTGANDLNTLTTMGLRRKETRRHVTYKQGPLIPWAGQSILDVTSARENPKGCGIRIGGLSFAQANAIYREVQAKPLADGYTLTGLGRGRSSNYSSGTNQIRVSATDFDVRYGSVVISVYRIE